MQETEAAVIDDPRMPDRFWSKVSPEPNTGCWLWTGSVTGNGYGKIQGNRRGELKSAHRWLYETVKGEVASALDLDHLCRVRSCVNPEHLEPVTRSENLRRGLTGKVNNPSAAKTQCPQGHPYDEANTIRRKGRRHCRACETARSFRVKKPQEQG